MASEINCTPETISRWNREPEFEAFLNQLKWELLDAARDALRAATQEAAYGLRDLIRHAESEETKRKACMDVLELTGLKNPQNGLYGWGIEK